MLQQIQQKFNELPTLNRRLLLTLFLFFDSLVLGLTYGSGSLNLFDIILLDKLPTDLIWLLQLLESISAGFLVIKIVFDDIPPSAFRTLAIFFPHYSWYV